MRFFILRKEWVKEAAYRIVKDKMTELFCMFDEVSEIHVTEWEENLVFFVLGLHEKKW